MQFQVFTTYLRAAEMDGPDRLHCLTRALTIWLEEGKKYAEEAELLQPSTDQTVAMDRLNKTMSKTLHTV